MAKQSVWPICGQTRRGEKGGLAGVLTQDGAPGRQAGRQAGIWHPSNHTRPQRLTAGAARCMKSHRFTQRRWTAGDAAAIFNPRPPSRTPPSLMLCLRRSPSMQGFIPKMSYSPFKKRWHLSQCKASDGTKWKCQFLIEKKKKSPRGTEYFLFYW